MEKEKAWRMSRWDIWWLLRGARRRCEYYLIRAEEKKQDGTDGRTSRSSYAIACGANDKKSRTYTGHKGARKSRWNCKIQNFIYLFIKNNILKRNITDLDAQGQTPNRNIPKNSSSRILNT